MQDSASLSFFALEKMKKRKLKDIKQARQGRPPQRPTVTICVAGLDSPHLSLVFQRLSERQPGLCIPDPRGVVGGRGHNAPAIRTEFGRINPISMPERLRQRKARFRIPQLGTSIP
jgi:hypothetical protein